MQEISFVLVCTVNNDKRIQSMKKGVIFWVTFTLSLLAMTARTGTSSQSIAVPLGPVQVKRGNDVTLWCKLENHSKNGVPVHWQTPPNFRTRTSNCDSFVKEKYVVSCLERWYNMTIVNVQWDDKGKYRCVHTGHIGIVDLQVLVPLTDVSLTYLSSPGEHQNTEFIFKCSTNCAYPAPTVTWFENDPTFLVKSEEHKCTDDKDGLKQTISTLAINVEQKKKLSKISCSAKDSFGVKKTSKAIDELTGSSQGIRVLPGPVEVKQGNNVTLWCELKNNAESKAPVYWHLPNFQTITTNCVSYMEKKYHISCAENGLRWYNLTIVDVQWKDKGIYRCISANGKTVDLRVLVPVTRVSLTHVPTSKKELLFLDKDNDAVLTCTTNCAYPAPSISWFENNKPFIDSPKVIITESGCTGKKQGQKRTISTITVIGKYVGEERKQSNISCTGGTGESNVSRMVNIRYNALLTGACLQNTSTLLSGPVKVKEGNNISLWCRVIDDSANEVPVHWQTPPKFTMITSNCDTFVKQKYVMSCAESGDRSYNMTIIDVQWGDKGKYRCVHTRPMGIVELQVLVPVSNLSLTQIPPSEEELLHLDKDSYAVLTCTTNCAYPAPNISWFENGQTFNGSVEVTITECKEEKKGQKQTKSTITVIGKYMGEEREHFCTAGNFKGVAPLVSRMVNVRFNEIAKPPQHVMAASATVATIVVPVLLIVVLIITIIILCKENKKRKKLKKDAEVNVPLLHVSESFKKELLKSVIYEYDDTTATPGESLALLHALREGLRKHSYKVELREVMQCGDITESKIFEKFGQDPRSKKVILSFPEDKFSEEKLVETFNTIMQGGDEMLFMAVIILTEAFMALPSELQRIEKLWIEKKGETQGFGRAKYHLHFLQDETTKQVDVTLMNLGTGLAWSYYLGYLRFLLSVFKETVLTSLWQNENPDIPERKISKQIHIVFSADCQRPKIMYNSERIKVKWKKTFSVYRAGLMRDYVLAIQEVKSEDGNESYYGVVCFLNIVLCLSEMESDPNEEFFFCDKDDVRTHGQDCFEKLQLIIKYNEKIKEDESKFDFIEFNAEAANADENDLADELFSRMKKACSLETRSQIHEAPATDIYQTGVLSDPLSADIKEFVDNLENSITIINCPHVHGRTGFGLKIIRESKRIFLVLTDEFVRSADFAKWFYMILDKGFRINDKRFLVCLNCLKENANYPKVLELEQLFACVYYTQRSKWADMVNTELKGAVEEIRYDHLSHNIGTGLAMSWYYKFLKIKIPKVRDVIEKCPVLWEKFQEGRMSHKVFILFPSSCHCPEELPCVDIIQEVDSKEINLPHIKQDNRDYTPKVYKLDDYEEEYYAFVEYSAPAVTMYELMHEGFLKMPEKILQEEWERFRTTLYTLINHKYEPMDIKNRVFFIPYDDAKLKEQDLEFKLLDHVKDQLPPKSERKLPTFIENGATVEETRSSVPATIAATDEDIGASGGLAEADATASANTIGV